MTIRYYRDNHSTESLDQTVDHVIDHICDCAEGDVQRGQVDVHFGENPDGSTKVFGILEGYDASTYDLPAGYEEPSRNREQRGFGERVMDPAELEEHLIRKTGADL